jgi:hypothetical protein
VHNHPLVEAGCAVSYYRVHIIGKDGQVKSTNLDCSNDAAAIESAKQLIGAHEGELWHGERQVARFEARKK